MALSTRVDNILLLLYAPGANGTLNAPLASVARLHHLVYLLQQEGQLWLPRGRATRYVYVQNEFGLYSADFFDDVFSLLSLNYLNLEKSVTGDPSTDGFELRRYFHDLTQGERLWKEFEHVSRSRVSLSSTTGFRLGAMIYDVLASEECEYIASFKSRFAEQDLAPHVQP